MVASRLIPEIRLNAHIGKNACEIEKNKNNRGKGARNLGVFVFAPMIIIKINISAAVITLYVGV